MTVGLFTGLLTFPLAPVRGTVWIAEQLRAAAEEKYYDPEPILARLDEIEQLRQTQAIDEAQAEAEEAQLVERLLEGRERLGVEGG
jgi:hypothetical protein